MNSRKIFNLLMMMMVIKMKKMIVMNRKKGEIHKLNLA